MSLTLVITAQTPNWLVQATLITRYYRNSVETTTGKFSIVQLKHKEQTTQTSVPESLFSFRLLLIRSTDFFLLWFLSKSFSLSRTLFGLFTFASRFDGNKDWALLISSRLFSRTWFLSTLTTLTGVFSPDHSSSLSHPFSNAIVLSSIIFKSFSLRFLFLRPPSRQQHRTVPKITTSPTTEQAIPIMIGLGLPSGSLMLTPRIFVPLRLFNPLRHLAADPFKLLRPLSSLRLLLDSILFEKSTTADLLTRGDFSDSMS